MYLQLYFPKREHLFPVSEADNIKDTDKDEDNMLFVAVDESDITELFESSEMQQILGSENTKKIVTVGRQRRQSEGVYVKGKIHGIHGTFTIDTVASRSPTNVHGMVSPFQIIHLSANLISVGPNLPIISISKPNNTSSSI
jgi:hypothetical protein